MSSGSPLVDHDYPGSRATERFHTSLASLAEIVVFVALGLTVSLGFVFSHGIWLDGLILTALVVLIARPLATWPLLIRNPQRGGFDRLGGLKGAVPILLASFALARDIADAGRIYTIVFVVVTLSVTLQAATIPTFAWRLRIPIEPLDDGTRA